MVKPRRLSFFEKLIELNMVMFKINNGNNNNINNNNKKKKKKKKKNEKLKLTNNIFLHIHPIISIYIIIYL